VLQGVQAATLQRTLGWKEMGRLTKQTAHFLTTTMMVLSLSGSTNCDYNITYIQGRVEDNEVAHV